MTDGDRGKFGALLVGTADIYSKKLTETLVKLYWTMLKKFNYEQLELAFYKHIEGDMNTQGNFFPKPADIIRLIDNKHRTSQDATIAWYTASSAVRRIGSYVGVKFEDAIIHLVIKALGGWPSFVHTHRGAENDFGRRRFVELYEIYSHRRPNSTSEYLTGIYESDAPILVCSDFGQPAEVMIEDQPRDNVLELKVSNE